MQQVFTSKAASYFSRWTRKSYAIFNSLNKVIQISGLSVVISATFLPTNAVAQEEKTKDTKSDYYLDEVELVEPQELQVFEVPSRVISVVSSRELKSAPIETVQDILNNISQLDLRQRGNNDVQADISIRGGTFDQVLVMLNGINITNPQTGHHNLDLPISFDQIERVEILNGAGSLSFGANAYSGVINIITKSSAENSASVKAVVGSYATGSVGASANVVVNKVRHYIALNSDFSDGYTDNTDFLRVSGYYNGKYLMNNSYLQWQLAVSDKSFGAQSFYTAKYPNQFEQTQSSLASLKFASFGDITTESQIYWNMHSDRFELFRNNNGAPSWYKYHNYHLTNVTGGNTKFKIASVLGKTTLSLDLRYEQIESNVLGEPTGEEIPAWFNPEGYYDKEASRFNTSVSLEQSYKYKGFSTIVALMINNNSAYADKINFYPGVDINYKFNDNFTAKASFNKTLRLPTFTDLYYVGPANVGNPDLIPEEAVNFDLGINYSYGILDLNLTSFNSFGNNTIDWVRKSDTEKWKPMNLTTTETYGIDISTNLRLGELNNDNFFVRNLTVQYTFINKGATAEGVSSAYVNDYLKHKFVFGVVHKIYGKLSANWKLRYQQRNGNYMYLDETGNDVLTPYGDYTLLDARVNWNSNGWMIFADVKNIFDTQYVDYGNVLQPGRWLSIGVKKDINF
jgi:iron complex outermembrane receptor protein